MPDQPKGQYTDNDGNWRPETAAEFTERVGKRAEERIKPARRAEQGRMNRVEKPESK